MKSKKLLFLILIVFIGLIFYFVKNQGQKKDPIISFLNQQYSNKYLVKSYVIGNFFVISANSNTSCCGENSIDSFDEKATPAVIIQDLNSQKIKSIYEIDFITNAADGKFNKGNIIHLSDATQVKNYFVEQLDINWGGSGGLKGMIVFGNINGQFQPITGYPLAERTDMSINVTDKISSKKYSFPITGDSNFSEVRDLNNDGIPDLLFADWKWNLENGESHYVPRPWNLQVFELVNNTFRVAKWWNKGEVYKTPENIGYSEADTYTLRQIFYDKSK